MIVFSCPECGTHLQALDENVGKKARCQCGAVVPVPQATERPPATYDPAPLDPADPIHTTGERRPHVDEGVPIGSILWGVLLMVGGVIWFVGSMLAGRTSTSAFVIFFIGLFRVISGFNRK